MPALLHPKPSTDDLLRAARAVSPCNSIVTLLNPDNSIGSRLPWHPDLTARAYMVDLSCQSGYHTLALDLDAKLASPDQADQDSLRALEVFTACGLRAIRCESGPDGGRHVFVSFGTRHLSAFHAHAIIDGFVRLGLKTLDPKPMKTPNTGAIRPPLALHRAGEMRSVFLDNDTATALAILESPNDLAGAVVLAREFRRREKQWPLVAPEGPVSEMPPAAGRSDRTGSADVQSIITQHVNRKTGASACRTALLSLSEATAAGASVARRRQVGAFEAWFQRSWDAAVEFVRTRPAKHRGACDDGMTLASWRSHLPAHEPELTDGERRVARHLLSLADGTAGALIGLSNRTAAMAVGISQATAFRALNGLADKGYIERAGEVDGDRARRYRLQPAKRWAGCAGASVCPSFTGGVSWLTDAAPHAAVSLAVDLQADVWRRDGLGETARFVYEQLALRSVGVDGGGVTATSLAGFMGVTANAVRRPLNKLQRHGLARSVGDGNWAAEVRDAEEVARALGVMGKNRADRLRMEGEQVDHRVRLLVDRVSRRLSRSEADTGTRAAA